MNHALEQMRQRRGQARSIAAGHGTSDLSKPTARVEKQAEGLEAEKKRLRVARIDDEAEPLQHRLLLLCSCAFPISVYFASCIRNPGYVIYKDRNLPNRSPTESIQLSVTTLRALKSLPSCPIYTPPTPPRPPPLIHFGYKQAVTSTSTPPPKVTSTRPPSQSVTAQSAPPPEKYSSRKRDAGSVEVDDEG